ncbi:MAG: hypothetical protein F9K29_21695 [Hyphomicrobiaceae bacterium]|nr:MAG: hypothetical protein F9K29_21695 [Hyphomicrobiaceae bacterium]
MRLANADNNHEATLKRFAEEHVAAEGEVTTDGLASCNPRSLGNRPHEMSVQTPAEPRQRDSLQSVHLTVSLLKRWLLGTRAGAVKPRSP